MKNRVYSIVFLVSLMAGLIQPVLPLMEYYTLQERIIGLFCINKDKPDMHCNGTCYLQQQIERHRDAAGERPHNLLAMDRLPNLVPPPDDLPGPIIPGLSYRYGVLCERAVEPVLPEPLKPPAG